jgi:hypothetical protein
MSSQTQIVLKSNHSWKSLQLVGGIAALLAAFVFRRWLSAEFDMFRALGIVHFQLEATPSTTLDWFGLLHRNAFVGLLLLNAFDLVNYVLAAFMYLGIYSFSKGNEKAYLRVAMVLIAIGAAIYIASNQALNLLSLGNQYFASTNDIQKSSILSAGQYALTVNDPVIFGTATFWGYMLFYCAGLLLSIGLVKGAAMPRWIGVVGIVANAFGLGYFFTAILGSSLSIIPALGSAPTNLVWYIATSIQLIRVWRTEA